MKKWLAVLVGLLSLSVPAQVVIDNPVTDAVTLNGKPGSYYLASSSQLWAVRTNDTREIDLTGADLKVADSSASDHPVTRSELDAFRDEIGVTEFYFNTNSHPLVAASGRLQVTIPDACTYSPGALGAGTTVLKTFWLANATTRIRDGMYHTTCYARRTTGNSAAYMKWELLSSADSMATTNVLVTATNTQNILGSSFLPYETLKGLQDDTVGTNLYLGVRLSVVREAGGSGATIGFAGGVGNPAHLATPGIGDVSGYVLAGTMFTGAGTTGMVTSAAGDITKFLRGDGAWQSVETIVGGQVKISSVLAPSPGAGNALFTDGTTNYWSAFAEVDPHVTNYVRQATTLAPSPTAGYFLQTDGSTNLWVELSWVPTAGTSTYAVTAGTSDYATVAGSVSTAGYATTAGSLVDSSKVQSASERSLYYTDGATVMLDWSLGQASDVGGFLSIDWVNRILHDAAALNSIDWVNRILHDATAVNSIDWASRYLYGLGPSIRVDWENGLLNDGAVALSIDWLNRTLSVGAVTRYDWSSGLISDAASISSVDTASRYLYDAGGMLVLDWANGQAKLVSGNVVLDWFNETLYDLNGVASVNWTSRQLLDASGIARFDWSSGLVLDASNVGSLDTATRVLQDASGNTVVDWASFCLYNASSTLMVDWANGYLNDASPYLAINWPARQLVAADGATVKVDWSSGVGLLRDDIGNIAYDWETKVLNDNAAGVSVNCADRQLSDGTLIAADWSVRSLYDSSGTTSLDWENCVLTNFVWHYGLVADGTYPDEIVNWTALTNKLAVAEVSSAINLRTLSGDITASGEDRLLYSGNSVDATVDWGICQLISTNTDINLDWGACQLMVGMSPKLDWANYYLYDAMSEISLDWGNRYLVGEWIATNIADSAGDIVNYECMTNHVAVTAYKKAGDTLTGPMDGGAQAVTNLGTLQAGSVLATNTVTASKWFFSGSATNDGRFYFGMNTNSCYLRTDGTNLIYVQVTP